MAHFLYVIGSPDNSFDVIKVGITGNIEQRLTHLQAASPLTLVVLSLWKLRSRAHARAVEADTHRQFGREQKHFEWFTVNAYDVVGFIDRVKFIHRGGEKIPILIDLVTSRMEHYGKDFPKLTRRRSYRKPQTKPIATYTAAPECQTVERKKRVGRPRTIYKQILAACRAKKEDSI